ncbi:MAG: RND transporter [Thermoanaerobaculia bacterium]|nr:RND transporter [Thermoanaerobaculia bacterium]
MQFLERIPYTFLIVFAIVMALLPFGSSHLLEKSRMLMAGTLRRPIDWFDLVWHSWPLLLLAAKLAAQYLRGSR